MFASIQWRFRLYWVNLSYSGCRAKTDMTMWTGDVLHWQDNVNSWQDCADLCASWDGTGTNNQICQYWEYCTAGFPTYCLIPGQAAKSKVCYFKKGDSSCNPPGKLFVATEKLGTCPKPSGSTCKNKVAEGETKNSERFFVKGFKKTFLKTGF